MNRPPITSNTSNLFVFFPILACSSLSYTGILGFQFLSLIRCYDTSDPCYKNVPFLSSSNDLLGAKLSEKKTPRTAGNLYLKAQEFLQFNSLVHAVKDR